MIPRKFKSFIIFYITIGFIITGFCNFNFDIHISNFFVPRDIDKPLKIFGNNNYIDNPGPSCDFYTPTDGKIKYCQMDYSCPKGNEYQRQDIDMTPYDYITLNRLHPTVSAGGIWQPCLCLSRQKLTIIVPYRNRDSHLRVFLNNVIPFLQQQQVMFRILVIEQTGNELFNRAALLNIGYKEGVKLGDFDCFIFHDVDLVPEDWCNLYTCGKNPRHLAVAMNKFDYKLPYAYYCGGALALNNACMTTINGFSNIMFGWGGEDDDTYARFLKHGFKVKRYNEEIGKYTMVEHSDDKGNPKSGRSGTDITNNWMYSAFDGLNSLNYTVVSRTLYQLYTKITVSLIGPTTVNEAKEYFLNTTQSLRKRLFKDKNEKEKVYHVIGELAKQKRSFMNMFFKGKSNLN